MEKKNVLIAGLSTDEVSYQIRFQGNTTDRTKIKFMTDGVLLRKKILNKKVGNYGMQGIGRVAGFFCCS